MKNMFPFLNTMRASSQVFMTKFMKQRNNIRKRSVKWSVTAQLQVIKALIKVEWEMTMGKLWSLQRFIDKMGAGLKPPTLVLRVKAIQDNKCHKFHNLMQTYKIQ